MVKGVFMSNYLIKRILHGLVSILAVVAIVMLLIYSCLDREAVFSGDGQLSKLQDNALTVYKYRQWEKYGYIDYVPYSDYLSSLVKEGELSAESRDAAAKIGRTEDKDTETAAKYVAKFSETYTNKGYTVVRLNASVFKGKVLTGGSQQLFAYKDISVFVRLWKYVTGIFEFDNIHYATGDVGKRGLSFTLHDPAYGGKKFSPAIMGNGTKHKYLLYFDNKFPFIHQNLITISLGNSYSVNRDVDVFDTMTNAQGTLVKEQTYYPTSLTELSSDDLHTLVYSEGSLEIGGEFVKARYTDDYTIATARRDGKSKMGYSFVIGIIATVMAYLLGVPLGVLMAKNKDKFFDKLGTIYIVFIIAVPSLAYIFLFKTIGGKVGLPTTFNVTAETALMYVLPIVSLALPSIAGLMKWMRRYMIDQSNADYVKFARSGGLTEGEIFRNHIMKNAAIPIVHGIPASVLAALVGAIITERVYVVPGTGNLLTKAINSFDNGVIVGVTLFYAILSVTAIILGDILMSVIDPRISFSAKAR